jgi:hypothetical protein
MTNGHLEQYRLDGNIHISRENKNRYVYSKLFQKRVGVVSTRHWVNAERNITTFIKTLRITQHAATIFFKKAT